MENMKYKGIIFFDNVLLNEVKVYDRIIVIFLVLFDGIYFFFG